MKIIRSIIIFSVIFLSCHNGIDIISSLEERHSVEFIREFKNSDKIDVAKLYFDRLDKEISSLLKKDFISSELFRIYGVKVYYKKKILIINYWYEKLNSKDFLSLENYLMEIKQENLESETKRVLKNKRIQETSKLNFNRFNKADTLSIRFPVTNLPNGYNRADKFIGGDAWEFDDVSDFIIKGIVREKYIVSNQRDTNYFFKLYILDINRDDTYFYMKYWHKGDIMDIELDVYSKSIIRD